MLIWYFTEAKELVHLKATEMRNKKSENVMSLAHWM